MGMGEKCQKASLSCIYANFEFYPLNIQENTLTTINWSGEHFV